METLTTYVSYPFSILFPLLLITITGVIKLYHSSTRRRRGGNLPPGSLGWPLLGESLSMVSAYKSEDPEPFADARMKRYGKIFTTHLFGEKVVFSADAEFNRLVINGEGRNFELDYYISFPKLLGRNALINMKGAPHQRMHSFTTARFASLSALRDSCLPEIDRLVRGMLDSWRDGEKVLLHEQVKKLGFDLGMKLLMSEDSSEWTEALRRDFICVLEGFDSLPLPSCLSFSFTTFGKAIKARRKVAEELKRRVIRKRRDRVPAVGRIDVLDELLMMEDGLDEDGVVDFVVSVLVGSYDTAAIAITTAVSFLMENPSALFCLREEHEQIMRGKQKDDEPNLEWKDYEAMSFTQLVINETLRITNVAPGVLRRATTDIDYKGYTIPKGCKIYTWFRPTHLDDENFKDARMFNPWRWENTNNESSSNIFMPFGGGPRLCPGYKLARLEISVFLHYFVTRLSWNVAEKDRLIFFPYIRTAKGFPIIIKRNL